VDDVIIGKPVRPAYNSLPGVNRRHRAALPGEFRAGCLVNGPCYTATDLQLNVGRIDNCITIGLLRNIAFDAFDDFVADLSFHNLFLYDTVHEKNQRKQLLFRYSYQRWE
jgi:hypothetical protein